MLVAVVGILLIVFISIVVTWLLAIVRRRLGKTAPVVVWALILLGLFCTILSKYLPYRSANTVEMDLPIMNSETRPNFLLVTLDTLRADYLGCYGNKIVQTPELDALAADGCLFEAAFSQAPTTTPSHCSIMTSTYAAQHGAINGSAMKMGFPTLAEILRLNGYETSAFVSSYMVRSNNTRLHHGFDYYEDSISPYTTLLKNDESQFLIIVYIFSHLQNNQIRGDNVSDRAIKWLDKHKQEPFFCWLHYFDPHDPYDAPHPYKNMYDNKINKDDLPMAVARSRYAGEVTYTDTQLGRYIDALKRKGIYDDMLIIVTSDHGEAFGEKHGDITDIAHGNHLYDATQHVPLIVKLPRRQQTRQRCRDVVQLVDLAPTVLEYMGASLPQSFQGKSLLDLLNGQQRSKSGVAFAESQRYNLTKLLPGIGQDTRIERQKSIRTAEHKYIVDLSNDFRQELYDLISDPHETINISTKKHELAKKYYQRIEDTLGKLVETEAIELDPGMFKRLKSLGYIDQ